MARLPDGGATIASPYRSEDELKRVLFELGVGQSFDEQAIHELNLKIGVIIGQWLSEQHRLEVSPVAKALLYTAKNLTEVSRLMSGLETGMHSDIEVAVASETAQYLALDPTVGSLANAQELVSAFHRDAARIAHVCMIARAGLPDKPGERGRRALDWYDDFTALLYELADKAGVMPTLRKDRITGLRSGWLFEAAQALESFLYPEMRSPSAEACGSRLDRSKRRLTKAHRQNRPSR